MVAIRPGLIVAVLCATAFGKPVRRSMQVHEARKSVPAGFTTNGAAPPNTTLALRLALVHNDDAGLIDALYDVSTPSSESYGRHLSREQVDGFVAPKAESLSVVNAWLSENGLSATPLTSAGDWLAIELPLNQSNDLFDANFSVYTHSASGQRSIRTLSYSIPTDLVGHLDLVHPTVTFSTPYQGKADVDPLVHASGEGSLLLERVDNCITSDGFMTPACLQSLYNIPTTPATQRDNGLAVTGYTYQWPQYDDLANFLKEFRPDMNPNTSYVVASVDNGTDPQKGGGGWESALDIQYTVGLATDVNTTYISVGGFLRTDDDFASALIDTAAYILNQTAPPQVMTTSYGDNENLISQNLANNLCNMLAQLGTRGVSVIYASGDGGVSGSQFDDLCTTFIATFPSGCPYVTSVGATINIPEQAANFSAGGFSNYWAQPAFQASAVNAYIHALNGTNAGLYNASGRAYPDVAAYGWDYEIIADGEVIRISGTSAAAPTFASVIALLNDQLLAAGKATLGWLNPWLYSTAAAQGALNDITEGNNYACSNYTTGFNATIGWDPVTGLGTPNFAKLLTAAGL